MPAMPRCGGTVTLCEQTPACTLPSPHCECHASKGGVTPVTLLPSHGDKDRPLSPFVTAIPSQSDTVTGVTGGYSDNDVTRVRNALRNAAWLDNQHLPELQYVVDGLLTEGLTLLAAAPKVGKSWLVAATALAVASGDQVLGQTAAQRPVLYLALEDGERRLQTRLRKLMAGRPLPAELQYVLRLPDGMTAPAFARAWRTTLPTGSPPPVVIIDTLGKARPGKRPAESEYAHDYRVGGSLKELADEWPGSAVIAVHHDRKAESADFVDTVSGTNGLAGSADTIFVIKRDRNAPESVLHITGRDVHESEYAAHFDDGFWTLTGDSMQEAADAAAKARAQAGKGQTTRQVVDWIEATAGGSPKEVADALGITYDNAKTILSRLYREQRLDRDAGKYFMPGTKR